MASQCTFNGVSLDDPGGRWTVDREWYLPQGGPGVASLPVEAPAAALVSADPWDGRYAPEVAVVVSFSGDLSPRDDTWWRLREAVDSWKAGVSVVRRLEKPGPVEAPAFLAEVRPLRRVGGGRAACLLRFRLRDVGMRSVQQVTEMSGILKFPGSLRPMVEVEAAFQYPKSGCALTCRRCGRSVRWFGEKGDYGYLTVDLSRRLAVLTNWDFSYSGLDVSDGLVVDPLWALCPGVDGTCQFSIEGKVRARPYYV